MLRQSQIRSYFSRRAAEEKKAGKKVCRAPQESDDEGDAGGSEVLVDGNPYAGLAMSELTKLVRDRGHAVTHGATPEDVRDPLTALDAATGVVQYWLLVQALGTQDCLQVPRVHM